ncbi:MAG: SGNH/GDSL hydrolase family protein [Bacteroidota bacterium]
MAVFAKQKEEMKNPVLKYVLIIFLPLVVLGIYSFVANPFNIFGVPVKQTPIKDFMVYAKAPRIVHSAIFALAPEIKDTTKAIDTSSQRILFFGDSMLEGLMVRLNDYCAKNNHDMKPIIWYSSSTKVWGECDTLTHFIKQYKPTYIFICLGSNELFIKDIIEERDPFVKHLLKEIDTIPYVWIGPPNWKDDTGINELIESNVGRKRYYPSKNLTYDRGKDGAHPTRASAIKWMDSVAVWIEKKSMDPIRLTFPGKVKAKKSTNAILLQPPKN